MTPATAGPCYVIDVDLCTAWANGIAIAERELGMVIQVKKGFRLFAPHGNVLEVDAKELHENNYLYFDEDNEDAHESFVDGADEAKQRLQLSCAISYSGVAIGKQHVPNKGGGG